MAISTYVNVIICLIVCLFYFGLRKLASFSLTINLVEICSGVINKQKEWKIFEENSFRDNTLLK